MPTDPLKQRWDGLIAVCGADPARASAFYQTLVVAYSEPHRAYHNLTHIAHFFAELDAASLQDPAVEWATWYHDAVYQPGARDNEANSAALAAQAMALLGLSDGLQRQVARLIEATASHRPLDDSHTQALFLDADIAILGAEPARYAAYADAVRREFGHVPGFLYRRGRSAFLKAMLDRPELYLTAHFRERYEAQARVNLTEELQRLRA